MRGPFVSYLKLCMNHLTMFLVEQVSWLVKDCNIGIFSDTINVINVKVCMMILLTELFLLIPFLLTLALFQGKKKSNSCTWKSYLLIWSSWNFVGLFSKSSRWWICHYYCFHCCIYSGDIIDMFSGSELQEIQEQELQVGFFVVTVSGLLNLVWL